jgi:hypothetical protein
MIPPTPTDHPSDELTMKMELRPAEAEETSFHPPPNPTVPDQCQKAPETESTAHASVELVEKTDPSFCAPGPESPAIANCHETGLRKSATAAPPLPPTAKPESALGEPGGPKETPRRSEVVPEATRVQDEPSKYSVVPSFPTAQPLFDAKIATPFKLSAVEADGLVRAADNGTATKSKSTDKDTQIIGRNSCGYTSSQSLMGIASVRIIASQRLLCRAGFSMP